MNVIRTHWKTASALVALVAFGVSFAASEVVRYVVVSILGLLLYGAPSQRDRENATTVGKAVIDAHVFTHRSASIPGRVPVFWRPGSNGLLRLPAEITVYDVQQRAEQDQIVATAKRAISDCGSKPIDLRFLDHENWIVKRWGGQRGAETQLRCVRVSDEDVHELAGKKTIKPPRL